MSLQSLLTIFRRIFGRKPRPSEYLPPLPPPPVMEPRETRAHLRVHHSDHPHQSIRRYTPKRQRDRTARNKR